MKLADLFHENHRATYCPEDDKLRLYVGRVPRDQYEFLRAQGWTSTPKQSEAGQGEFAAVWTPSRQLTAEAFAGIVEDEDAGPEERAADRAERFGGYRDKRRDEASTFADKYEDPQAVGFQSEARAARAAARQERQGGYAVDAWGKAEYWQRRTAGVISNALYKSSPSVRMGRIKTLEAELRKLEKEHAEYRALFAKWQEVATDTDTDRQNNNALYLCGVHYTGYNYKHPRPDAPGLSDYLKNNATTLYSLLSCEAAPITGAEAAAMWLEGRATPGESSQWIDHIKLRLAYEWQMLEAQGGRAAVVEMEPGGFLGKHQLHKVNKSLATGRVVSVEIRYMSETNRWGNAWPDGKPRLISQLIKTERMGADAYRPPTDEERAAFNAARDAERAEASAKSKAKKEKGEDCPLINPTDEDAAKLQEIWNAASKPSRWDTDKEPPAPLRITQAKYSEYSKGSHSAFETVTVCEEGTKHRTRYGSNITRHNVFKVRSYSGRVVILEDKPQKPIPWERLDAARAKCPTPESLYNRLPEIAAMASENHAPGESNPQLWSDAEYVRLVWVSSWSQFGLSEKGKTLWDKYREEHPEMVNA
jgi:hypothetical protein